MAANQTARFNTRDLNGREKEKKNQDGCSSEYLFLRRCSLEASVPEPRAFGSIAFAAAVMDRKPINRPLTKPLEWFDFFAQTYMTAKKETLLEWMKDHPDIESLRTKPQKEVAEIYCDRMAASIWQRGQAAKEKPGETAGAQPPEDLAVRLPKELVKDY
jgi:hypothetical protein